VVVSIVDEAIASSNARLHIPRFNFGRKIPKNININHVE